MNKLWKARLDRANAIYDEWATRFKCEALENYYEGFQHGVVNPIHGVEPYVVNLVYTTIKIQSANIELAYPKYLITPKPGSADYSQEIAILSAQIKEDVLNTIIDDEKESFSDTCHLTFLDSKFRFGVVEIGYAADWLRNPLAQPPLLDYQVTTPGEDTSSKDLDDKDSKIAEQPEVLPENERIYIKRIPARRFRVSSKNAQELDRCDWIGYYEFVPVADLKAIKGLKSEYLDNARVYFSEEDLEDPSSRSEKPKSGVAKVWHCWDNRAKKRFLLLDNPCEVIWEDDFKRLPVKGIRWDLRLKGWYPIPQVFQWLSPQNEYNETRNMMRSHRRRFVRKFQMVGDDLEPEELDKFTSGEDGSVIKVPAKDAIQPITNPVLDGNVKDSLIISKDDFNEVTGTSSADRGRADRTTATESQRLGLKADIRDSAEDSKWNKFLAAIGREILLLASERFVEGTWAKLGQDPGEKFLGELAENPAYQWVTSEQLDDGYDFKIAVEIISASPIRNDEEEKKFLKFLSIVNNFPQISLSPILVREAAYRCGYRNERVIQEMQKMAQLTMLGSINQAGGGGQGGSNVPQQITAQQTPNTQEQITNQLDNQLVQ